MLGSPGLAPSREMVTAGSPPEVTKASELLAELRPSMMLDGPTRTVEGPPGMEGGRVTLGSPGFAPSRKIVVGDWLESPEAFESAPFPPMTTTGEEPGIGFPSEPVGRMVRVGA